MIVATNELPRDAERLPNNILPLLLSRVWISTTEGLVWYRVTDDRYVAEMTGSGVVSFYYFGNYRKVFKFNTNYIEFVKISNTVVYQESEDIRLTIQHAFNNEKDVSNWLDKIKW